MNRDFRFTPTKKMENILPLDWCYWLGDTPKDYILTEWLLDSLPTLYQQDEKIYQYNQYKQSWSKKSCTVFNAIWWLSDLFNYEFDIEEIKERDEESYNHWRRKDEGWRVQLAIDLYCDMWNKIHSDLWKVAYYSIDLNDNELVKKVLDKRYTICTWYNGNAKFNNDKNADWVLNGTQFWTSTYWHAVNVIRWINTPARVKDNYYWTNKYNIYDIEHNFSEIDCFFARWFVFTKVKENNLERVKELNEMNTMLVNMIENNSKMRHLTNDESYKKELNIMNNANRQKQKDIEQQLILLS